MALARRPIGPFVGFCSQFLAMPAISYLLGYLLLEVTKKSRNRKTNAKTAKTKTLTKKKTFPKDM